ncbi:Nudix hydrolase 2 [Striga hermonthica]|uniref:Nudix hydrolase 2 n=1 Tax=Striga hermonthica TaxID=68872 RepID=A0A9N7RN55_STRHE|nr:Nudix hydrolase 2 [Striga hermonthica]
MITMIRFLCRPTLHISSTTTTTTRRHHSLSAVRRRASSASLQPFSPSRERLSEGRFGVLLNVRSPMTSLPSPALPAQQIDGGVLEAVNDDHGGVIVEMTNGPLDAASYVPLLRTSLSHWRRQGKRGIWIKLPIELANLIEPTVKEGFYFHHAEPNYLMLVSWLPSTPNTLPANASHRVGIGAFVLNEKNEVLVVQEKSGHFRGSGVWKIPTGVVDEGEDICDAAVREVKEETAIDSKFVEILAFRYFPILLYLHSPYSSLPVNF